MWVIIIILVIRGWVLGGGRGGAAGVGVIACFLSFVVFRTFVQPLCDYPDLGKNKTVLETVYREHASKDQIL